jgi:hypothetical protein
MVAVRRSRDELVAGRGITVVEGDFISGQTTIGSVEAGLQRTASRRR